jgi:hypothetical protein
MFYVAQLANCHDPGSDVDTMSRRLLRRPMMLRVVDKDQLFLETISDLQSRVAAPDEYGMLRTAALLRQLLLDSPRLIDEVNRQRRLRVTFRVVDKDAYVQMVLDDGAIFYSTEDGLDPNTAAFGQVKELNRDQFLKQPVMVVNGHTASVHDLIDQLAHIEGGIHAATARTDKEKALTEAGQVLGIGGLPAGVRMLAAIGRVVLSGLEELRRRVATS